jgi:hypothetical protein
VELAREAAEVAADVRARDGSESMVEVQQLHATPRRIKRGASIFYERGGEGVCACETER